MIVLDSDVLIDLLRQHSAAIAWLDSLNDQEIALPGFVVMEILQGCRNKVEQEKVERVLADFAILWPSPETCSDALHVFAQTHLSYGIGLLDALIGQTAVALGLPLYTFNQRHYSAIQGLTALAPYVR